MLRIRTFGGFSGLQLKGRTLAGRALELFGIFISYPERQFTYQELREMLARLGEGPPSSENFDLATPLSRMRRAIRETLRLNEEQWKSWRKSHLPVSRGTLEPMIRFSPPDDWEIDCIEFVKLVQSQDQASLRGAIQFYQGDFMPEIGDEPLWNSSPNVIAQKREEYKRLYNSILTRLIWPFQPLCPYKEWVDRGGNELTELIRLTTCQSCIAIQGPSGVGKTSLAEKLAKTLLHKHPDRIAKIIWASAKPGESMLKIQNLKDLYGIILRSFGKDPASYKQIDERELERKLQNEVIQLFQREAVLPNRLVVIILDNYETLPDKYSFLQSLWRALEEGGISGHYCLIVTSRLQVGLDFVHPFPIRELPEQSARQLFQLYLLGDPDKPVPDADWKKIYAALAGRAQLLKLLAGQLKPYQSLLKTSYWTQRLESLLRDLTKARKDVELALREPLELLMALRAGPQKLNELAQALAEPQAKVKQQLEKAIQHRLVIQRRDDRYELTEGGERSIDPENAPYTDFYWLSWKQLPEESRVLLLYLGQEGEALLPISAQLLEIAYGIALQGIAQRLAERIAGLRAGVKGQPLLKFAAAVKPLIDTYLLDVKENGMIQYDLHESEKHFLQSQLPYLEGWV
jgi:DNA polymerase III delta prime subunit